ncbi:hypothetical protein LTR60_001970, partial [Cryomyces antarcticus]
HPHPAGDRRLPPRGDRRSARRGQGGRRGDLQCARHPAEETEGHAAGQEGAAGRSAEGGTADGEAGREGDEGGYADFGRGEEGAGGL